jgi:hypothetical protein
VLHRSSVEAKPTACVRPLGSSTRDHEVRVNLLGRPFRIRRIGTDGSFKQATALLRELDGKVDAIGLGGIDIYLYSTQQRYALRDGLRLMQCVQSTPVVDGSGLKNTLERTIIQDLAARHSGTIPLAGRRVLVVCGMDRFGMAQALEAAGAQVTYGDLIFSIDKNQPIESLDELAVWAEKLLPELSRMPIGFLYPIGKQQETVPDPKHTAYYDAADIVAGDFHFIRKYMPARMDGKTIITNTVTEADIADLRGRGVAWLVTTTPNLGGRSFGTNVLEAALLSLLGKPWDAVTPDEYLSLINELGLEPRIEQLQGA